MRLVRIVSVVSFTLIPLFFNELIAQDERFMRKLFSGELHNSSVRPDLKEYKIRTVSPFYAIDLNEDGLDEHVIVEKKDGEDWIHIYGVTKLRIKSFQLEPAGVDSKLYRISLRKISSKTKVLLLHFYEGYNKYLGFYGSVRLYFVTIDFNNLRTLSIFKGPSIWEEGMDFRKRYHRRNLKYSLYDFNGDGIREIVVKHHLISRVYFYTDFYGKWKSK